MKIEGTEPTVEEKTNRNSLYVTLTIENNLDEVIEKVSRLNELLKETSSIIDSLHNNADLTGIKDYLIAGIQSGLQVGGTQWQKRKKAR